MPIPQLTSEQLASARRSATVARRIRADFKDRVKSGELPFAKALAQASGDDVLGHLRIVDLLKCVPRIGEKRAERIMERLGIAPNRRIRGLGRLQRTALLEEFVDG